MSDLKPCPFCGGAANFEQIGDRRRSCIISCEDCGARLETNEEESRCGEQWNDRLETENAALKVERDALEKWMAGVLETFHWSSAGFGVCCCGEPMDRHSSTDHSPVDSGIRAFEMSIGERPSLILARRDARVKAEALEEASMLYPAEVCAEFDSIRADLQGSAHHYRKQAEEMRDE